MFIVVGLKSVTIAVPEDDDEAVVVVSGAADVVDEVVEVEVDEDDAEVAALSCSRRSLDSWWRHFMRRFWNHTFTCGKTR